MRGKGSSTRKTFIRFRASQVKVHVGNDQELKTRKKNCILWLVSVTKSNAWKMTTISKSYYKGLALKDEVWRC